MTRSHTKHARSLAHEHTNIRVIIFYWNRISFSSNCFHVCGLHTQLVLMAWSLITTSRIPHRPPPYWCCCCFLAFNAAVDSCSPRCPCSLGQERCINSTSVNSSASPVLVTKPLPVIQQQQWRRRQLHPAPSGSSGHRVFGCTRLPPARPGGDSHPDVNVLMHI